MPHPASAHSLPMLVVAAALIAADGRILVQQRPLDKHHGGLWEFPGGKVEPGETPEAALARELAEELGIGVEAADLYPVAFSRGSAGDRPMVLLLYRAERWEGLRRQSKPRQSAGSRLTKWPHWPCRPPTGRSRRR